MATGDTGCPSCGGHWIRGHRHAWSPASGVVGVAGRQGSRLSLLGFAHPADDGGAVVVGWLDEYCADEPAGFGVDEDGGATVERCGHDAACCGQPGHDVGEETGDSVGAADRVSCCDLDVGATVEYELDIGDESLEEGVEVAAVAGGDEPAHDLVMFGRVDVVGAGAACL